MVAVSPPTSALPGKNNKQAWKDHIYIVRRAQLGIYQAASFGLNEEYSPAFVPYRGMLVGVRSKKVTFIQRVFQS